MAREEDKAILEAMQYELSNQIGSEYCRMKYEAVTRAIKALEEQEPTQIDVIPKDYVYDTETEDFVVYRHKYTGNEIHIKKPIPVYALEQKPSEDAVSREQAKKAIRDKFKDLPSRVEINTILNDLPPVTPTTCIAKVVFDKDELQKMVDEKVKELVTSLQEWIPVSEGLPLDRHAVLVWSINNTYCAYLEDEKWYIFGEYDSELKDVTAWMPLPNPYEGENEVEE